MGRSNRKKRASCCIVHTSLQCSLLRTLTAVIDVRCDGQLQEQPSIHGLQNFVVLARIRMKNDGQTHMSCHRREDGGPGATPEWRVSICSGVSIGTATVVVDGMADSSREPSRWWTCGCSNPGPTRNHGGDEIRIVLEMICARSISSTERDSFNRLLT